ncbi:MAG TPA: LLM class flavin-dependent oxidoreductase [Acidimicrobiales bacterium]|nr:LLM class flavin-dependent oxidoreductase [Acidimicrobiales bacterium]
MERQVHPWVAEGQKRPRFAIVSVFLPDWKDILRFAQRAERLGFDAYWANDHPNRSMDTWTLLTGLAMGTERIRLISLVSCIYYRSPVLIARQAADVDRISEGRLVLGIGIGDDVPEFNQMCLPFPPIAQRQETLEEALSVIQGLWREETFSFEGKYFRLDQARLAPKPVQDPYVPILIGGGGEKVTLRQVAQWADVSNFAPHEWSGSAFQIADVERKYAALRDHCKAVGRPYESILRSHFTPLLTLAENESALERKRANARIPDRQLQTVPVFATPDQAIAHYQALADVGVQYFLATINGSDDETVHLFAEAVVPAVKLAQAGQTATKRG